MKQHYTPENIMVGRSNKAVSSWVYIVFLYLLLERQGTICSCIVLGGLAWLTCESSRCGLFKWAVFSVDCHGMWLEMYDRSLHYWVPCSLSIFVGWIEEHYINSLNNLPTRNREWNLFLLLLSWFHYIYTIYYLSLGGYILTNFFRRDNNCQ